MFGGGNVNQKPSQEPSHEKDGAKVLYGNTLANTSESKLSESGNTGYLQFNMEALAGMSGVNANQEILDAQNAKRPLTRWERKKLRIMGEAGSMTRTFMTGFLMGGLIGGAMGGLGGAVLAFQYR